MKPIALLPVAIAALGLAMPAEAQAPKQREQTLSVTLTNHGISPARIFLRAGQPYALRFFNPSDRRHDFAVRSFFQDSRIAVGDGRKLDKGRVSLAPGEGSTIHLLAPRNRGGRYEFSSTQLQDANSGLKGNIFIR